MGFIKWNSTYNVHIKKIDNQHKKIISILNHIYDLQQSGNPKAIDKVLSELEKYARVHFSTEEVLFDKHEYPESIEHKKEHERFIKKIGEVRNKFIKKKINHDHQPVQLCLGLVLRTYHQNGSGI